MSSWVMEAMERGLIPDPVVRYGIRRLCGERLRSLTLGDPVREREEMNRYVEALKKSPIAIHTREANEQHYELPPEFFLLCLGKNRKYSSAYYPEGCRSLDEAEDAALNATMERAEIRDGMRILELGCGWGSLTLALARKFPNASIIALSNSRDQREFIEGEALRQGISNLRILTRNIVEVEDLRAEFGAFDRVVSVEMFEHLRNYQELFSRISDWLTPEGKLFVHVFTHKKFAYFFETEGEDNWMGRYFFTGGQMPSHDLFLNFQESLSLEKQWAWDGTHYGRTSEDWLKNLDRNRDRVLSIFEKTYGKAEAKRWFQRWRVFFLSCAELFNYRNGKEWGVSHYLFRNQGGVQS